MKPWEDKKTIEIFRKMSGKDTLKIGFELTESALHILIAGIKNRKGSLSKKKLEEEIEKCVWGRR